MPRYMHYINWCPYRLGREPVKFCLREHLIELVPIPGVPEVLVQVLVKRFFIIK